MLFTAEAWSGIADGSITRFNTASPWTSATLQVIATRPGVVSTALAAELGLERAVFKVNVRKLKELGLTESLEVG